MKPMSRGTIVCTYCIQVGYHHSVHFYTVFFSFFRRMSLPLRNAVTLCCLLYQNTLKSMMDTLSGVGPVLIKLKWVLRVHPGWYTMWSFYRSCLLIPQHVWSHGNTVWYTLVSSVSSIHIWTMTIFYLFFVGKYLILHLASINPVFINIFQDVSQVFMLGKYSIGMILSQEPDHLYPHRCFCFVFLF